MGRTAKLDDAKRFEARYLNLELPDRERLSPRRIEERFKEEYGVEIDHTNIGRAIARIDERITNDPATAKAYEEWKATKGAQGKVFYRTDPITSKVTSDYPTVQSYIDSAVKNERVSFVENLKNAEKCWLFLDKKDPASWTDDDVERYLREGRTRSHKPHTYQTKITYKISCRAVAPAVKAVEGGTLKHKQNIKRNVQIIKSPVFRKEFKEIVGADVLTDYEKFIFELHTIVGSREGASGKRNPNEPEPSILGLDWTCYDPRAETLKVYESKAVGWWEDIPIRKLAAFFDPAFADKFRAYWQQMGKPTRGYVLELGSGLNERYANLTKVYRKIRDNFDFLKGRKFTPHFARKTHANILWEQDVDPMLIIGDARTHKGWFGCGETDLQTYRDYYLDIAKGKLEKEYAKAGHFT